MWQTNISGGMHEHYTTNDSDKNIKKGKEAIIFGPTI